MGSAYDWPCLVMKTNPLVEKGTSFFVCILRISLDLFRSFQMQIVQSRADCVSLNRKYGYMTATVVAPFFAAYGFTEIGIDKTAQFVNLETEFQVIAKNVRQVAHSKNILLPKRLGQGIECKWRGKKL